MIDASSVGSMAMLLLFTVKAAAAGDEESPLIDIASAVAAFLATLNVLPYAAVFPNLGPLQLMLTRFANLFHESLFTLHQN